MADDPPAPDLASLRIHREAEKPRRPLGGLISLAVLVCAIGVAVYFFARTTLRVKSVGTVTAAVVTEGEATTVLSATGYVEADVKADLSPKITSKVTALYVTEGDAVKKGEVLARLDKSDIDAELAADQATWVNAQAQWEREQQLFKDGLAAKSDLDIAVAAEKSALAKVHYDQALESYTVIRAPFSGKITAKRADVGEAVSPFGAPGQGSTTGGAILTIVDFSTLYVGADINEANLGKLHLKQPAEIVLDAYPDHPYHGYLLQIIPTADRSKGTVKVKVAIEDKDARILPDMSARVNFTEQPTVGKTARTHVMVPQSAVLTRGDQSQVFAIVGGRAEARAVKLGPVNQGQVEILSGLEGGEVLVADPAHAGVSNGEKVKIREE